MTVLGGFSALVSEPLEVRRAGLSAQVVRMLIPGGVADLFDMHADAGTALAEHGNLRPCRRHAARLDEGEDRREW